MAMVERKENDCTRRFGRNHPLCIRDNSDAAPAEFGRVYAAYGGIFIVSAIIWVRIIDKKKQDKI